MNKYLKIILIVAGIFFGTVLIARMTHLLDVYTVATPSNEPSLRTGSFVFGSALVKPQRGKFLVYKMTVPETGNKEYWIFRIAAMPGDKLEIRNGDVFVNDQPAPDSARVYNYYLIHQDQATRLLNDGEISEGQLSYAMFSDSTLLKLSAVQFHTLRLNGRRYIFAPGENTEEIRKVWKKDWNTDHFGPLTVPEGKYFVLGDNRNHAMDSRYTGFVDKEIVAGCLITK